MFGFWGKGSGRCNSHRGRCWKSEGGSVALSVNCPLHFLELDDTVARLVLPMESPSTPPHLINNEEDYRTPLDDGVRNCGVRPILFDFVPPPGYSIKTLIHDVRMVHSPYCPEGGLCKRHKGLIEDQLKGLYCCGNIANTYHQVKRLKPVENKVLIYDMASSILLGELSPRTSARVLKILKEDPIKGSYYMN